MKDLLDLLKKEQKSETKLFKVEKPLLNYSEEYKKVVFEEHAPRESCSPNKELFLFPDSLNRLRKLGYERHPRPNEALGLLCADLESNSSVKSIAKDMISCDEEWLSLAIKYQNHVLHCYIDPELEWNQKSYEYNLKSCSSEMLFPLSGLEEKTYFTIKELHAENPDFVEFIWSRPFNELPLQIRESGRFYFYNKELVWPVGRGYCGSSYDVNCYDYYRRASRGVVSKPI